MRQNSPQSLTQARLKELLHYDPETGVFTWRIRSNTRVPAGSVAGHTRFDGYVLIRINKVMYLAHRLSFLYMAGDFPFKEVDHINGNPTDNSWANLRSVTRSENLHNLGGPTSTNTSGFLGVSWDKKNEKWVAKIKLCGVSKNLGRFTTPELAYATYLKAKDQLHSTHMRLRAAA